MSEPTEPIQKEVVGEPPYPEEFRSFVQNQEIFQARHADEVFPQQLIGDHIAIVFKASRELYNGNLGKQLLALAEQTVPTERFEAIIVVNNPRLYADIGEGYNKQYAEGAEDIQIAGLFEKTSERADLSPWELAKYNELTGANRNWEVDHTAIGDAISTFIENKNTLQILNTITSTTSRLIKMNDPVQEESLIAAALAEITSYFSRIMDEPTKALVLTGAKQAMEKRVRIYGIDCSTGDKGYRHKSLQQPMNEGAHIAYARGASYIDFRDMDEFPENAENLEELVSLLDLSPVNRPDVVLRAMDTMVAHHPDVLPDNDAILETIVQDYIRAISNGMGYGYINPQFHLGVGRLIVGKSLFHKHQYISPLGFNDESEDYSVNREYKRYMQLGVRLVRPASLLHVDSSLKVSSIMDSRRVLEYSNDLNKARNIDHSGSYIQEKVRDALSAGYEVESRLVAIVAKDPSNKQAKELLASYRSIREEYFTIQQTKRKKMRTILFGDSEIGTAGILPSVLPKLDTVSVLSADPRQMKRLMEDMMPQLQLPEDAKLYLAKNPMLIKGIIQASQKYHLDSQADIQAFLEERALPELLAPPLASEPDYNAIPQMLDDADSVFNLTDWYHVFQANQYLAARLLNLQNKENLPDELTQLVI